jgi:hypothetical protein
MSANHRPGKEFFWENPSAFQAKAWAMAFMAFQTAEVSQIFNLAATLDICLALSPRPKGA